MYVHWQSRYRHVIIELTEQEAEALYSLTDPALTARMLDHVQEVLNDVRSQGQR